MPHEVVEAAVEGRLMQVNMWTSHSVESSSGLHYDNYENYLLVLSGVKRALIFPPSQNKFLYRIPASKYGNCKNKPPKLTKKMSLAEQTGQIRDATGRGMTLSEKVQEHKDFYDYGL